MSDQPSFSVPPLTQAEETTGRYVITFREDYLEQGLSSLHRTTGVRGLPSAADFPHFAMDMSALESAGGAVFPALGIAVVTMDPAASMRMSALPMEDSGILAIEPERVFWALSEGLSVDYLRGYRDAADHLCEKALSGARGESAQAVESYQDDAQSTWGLKATKVMNSRYTGRDIKIAVLDTGFDLNHPDFANRTIISESFVQGQVVQDGKGHGTHCIGTACGFKDNNGRRYGIAHECIIYVGKVLNNSGSGYTSGIIAGMEWAITNGCQVISMSLGNTHPDPSPAYEAVGKRALQQHCLIVAAAGNHRNRPDVPSPRTVGQPANSPSIMAVGAVDYKLDLAPFSCGSGSAAGANVDIAAPGVGVYSSFPMDQGRYKSLNGTSMATPHVAGIAGLFAEANGATDTQLWQLLVSHARRLPIPAVDVGAGLAQAPQ